MRGFHWCAGQYPKISANTQFLPKLPTVSIIFWFRFPVIFKQNCQHFDAILGSFIIMHDEAIKFM